MPSSDSSHDQPRRNRRAVGRTYEQRAAEYLEQHDFTILDRNWQASHKEIDLIARKRDVVAFVEVKAATTDSYGHPAERMDRRKVGYLIDAARQYLQEHDLSGCDIRFDLITFYKGKLEHYEAAFTADDAG